MDVEKVEKTEKTVKKATKTEKKYNKVAAKSFNLGTKPDGTVKKAVKKGDILKLTKEQVEIYKNNNLI